MELHSVFDSRICSFFFFFVEAEGILLTRGRNKGRGAAAVSPTPHRGECSRTEPQLWSTHPDGTRVEMNFLPGHKAKGIYVHL